LKIVLFTFYYPPDISAGSFRMIALAESLIKKLNNNDELHIITTHPSRYKSHKVIAKDIEINDKIIIHRIKVPNHYNSMFSQAYMYIIYAFSAYKVSKKINPIFIIGSTSRLMTGLLAGFSSWRLGCKYFIDLRDIFSETISDLFLRRSKILGSIFKIMFTFLEKKLLKNASGVNVVSEDFSDYFKKESIDVSNWSFYPNGVDKEFLNSSLSNKTNYKNVKSILYVGNIGSGQGLKTILPAVAKKIGNSYQFLLIGDGRERASLEENIKNNNIDNIKILSPVLRKNLIKHYHDADILFLHLNNLPAFQRVLPSKIFEYIAMGKPIIAGLSGYSANFILENTEYVSVFYPGNVDQCVNSIKKIESLEINKDQIAIFNKKYDRQKIMNEMADHILTKV